MAEMELEQLDVDHRNAESPPSRGLRRSRREGESVKQNSEASPTGEVGQSAEGRGDLALAPKTLTPVASVMTVRLATTRFRGRRRSGPPVHPPPNSMNGHLRFEVLVACDPQ